MQRLRFVVPLAVLVLIAAACTSDDEGGGGETGGTTGAAQEENTGTVNVLSALSAEEGEAIQTLWDDTYGSQVNPLQAISLDSSLSKQIRSARAPVCGEPGMNSPPASSCARASRAWTRPAGRAVISPIRYVSMRTPTSSMAASTALSGSSTLR